MNLSVFAGARYFPEGLRLIFRPELRLFVVLPVVASVLVFAGGFYVLLGRFEELLASLTPRLPDFLFWLEYFLWPLMFGLLLLIIFFTFTLCATFVAAPFNGLLAEKVAELVQGHRQQPSSAGFYRELLAIAPQTFQREWQKLAYFVPRGLGLLVLSFIPGLNLLAAPLWLVFGAWMMAVQYLDYPADNQGVAWNDMLAWIRQRRWSSLGFGGMVQGALWIPGFNLLVMPAAIAGATLFWLDARQERDIAIKHVN